MQSISYRKLAFTYLGWCLCWVALQAIALRYTFGFDWVTSLTDALITNLLLAASGYEMILVMRYYQPAQAVRLGMSVILAVVCVFVTKHVGGFLVQTEGYDEFLQRSLIIRGLFSWLMITLYSALSWLWFATREHSEMQQRQAAAERLEREAELSRLRQQLQPHFLFNSLNSISALAGSRPDEARKMIQQLSDFLRGTLKKDDQQLVTFEEELKHLNLYLEIEKVRFGHRMKTNITHDEKSLIMKLPSLLLQPVLENAIKFGLYDTTGEVTIRVSARADNGYLRISVENPCDPSTTQPKKGTGFGLSSVQRRLYLLFARQDLLITGQHDNLFVTDIRIPQTA